MGGTPDYKRNSCHWHVLACIALTLFAGTIAAWIGVHSSRQQAGGETQLAILPSTVDVPYAERYFQRQRSLEQEVGIIVSSDQPQNDASRDRTPPRALKEIETKRERVGKLEHAILIDLQQQISDDKLYVGQCEGLSLSIVDAARNNEGDLKFDAEFRWIGEANWALKPVDGVVLVWWDARGKRIKSESIFLGLGEDFVRGRVELRRISVTRTPPKEAWFFTIACGGLIAPLQELPGRLPP